MERSLLALVLLLLLTGCGYGSTQHAPRTASTVIQTKTQGCLSHNGLPDTACTPGAIFPGVTTAQICVPGYTKTVRNVTEAEKQQVYRAYGITHHSAGEYEVDHLVPLELGGSNALANLWPEAANPTPGYHQKDALENMLHDRVCAGHEPLTQAQQDIASNWLSIYGRGKS